MKKTCLLKSMLLLFALIVGSVSAWGADADYTFTLADEDFTTSTHSKTSGAITWTHTHGAGDQSYGWDNTYGFKFGSGNKSYPTSFRLTSSSFSSKIKKVVVTASVNSGKSCSLNVTVGGTTYGSPTTINTKSNDTWEFSISDASTVNGVIELSFSSNTGPLYLKKIEVFYYIAGVTSLSVKTAPTKVRYEVGETLSMSGFVLDADGTEVSSGYTMTMGGSAITNGAALNSAGKKTLVVSYGGKTVNQAISVGNVTGISVTTAPTKTSYDTGDSFDATGMVVTASLSTGEAESPDTWTKEVTGYTISPDIALAPANTSVTITYSGKSTTQAITVTNVAVTGVSVKASTTIEKTKTETLTPTFTPTNATNKAVTWESDDTDVATVDEDGKVTAVAAGTANITVTTNDGGKTATCVVTVVNAKGTADYPYTVAEVIGGTATGTGKYVKGYIVGCYNNGNKAGFSTTNYNIASNLALADNANETNVNNTIAIQMPSAPSAIRSNFNVQDNPYLAGSALVVFCGSIESYINSNGLKSLSSATEISEIITVTNAGYATWASNFGLDYSGLGVKAYKATVSGTDITFDKVTEVPAGEGVLLQNEGTFVVPVKSVAAWAADANAFVRGTGAAVATGDGPYNYILNNGSAGVGFYKANGQTVAKNRAYLQTTTNNARIGLNFDDETTGISAVENSNTDIKNAVIYNLNGQRVMNPTKGLYIVNGKKVMFNK